MKPKHISFIQSYSSEITLRRRPEDLERVKLINVNNYSSQLNVRLINPCRGRGLGSHLSPHLRPFPRVHNSPIIISRARAGLSLQTLSRCVDTWASLWPSSENRFVVSVSSSQMSIFPSGKVTSNRVKICIHWHWLMTWLLTNDKAAWGLH